MTIRVPNSGDAPLAGKGQTGDLLVRVSVASSKLFRRQGTNLYHEARIPLHTALLGGRVRVPTLDGEVDVRVPGGTQQGEEMVLKGRGIQPVYGGNKGDMFVTFIVQIPRYAYFILVSPSDAADPAGTRSLSKRQREILQLYADDVEGRAPSAGSAEGSTSSPDAAPSTDGTDATGTNSSSSFTYPTTHRGGWWHRLRELTGF